MCGRFVSASPPDEIARYFDVDETALPELEVNYNVAPTNDVYAVAIDGGIKRVEAFHWGLVPSWAKDPKIGSKMINARSEGIESKNAYRAAFKRRRCIIPADGFYEWQKQEGKKKKQPYYIQRPDGEPLAFAGLWEVWRPKDASGENQADEPPLRSCTIITTSANATMEPLHDRMPVILPPSAWEEWLDPSNDDLDTLGKLLVPAPPSLIVTHPVSTEVNSVRNNGPELIEQFDPEADADEG
ncbi:MAG TPA: SOS response-associated peptidase [Acidimicrobiales bacterium]|jgi:putative SOS response-associated peptidase YedK